MSQWDHLPPPPEDPPANTDHIVQSQAQTVDSSQHPVSSTQYQQAPPAGQARRELAIAAGYLSLTDGLYTFITSCIYASAHNVTYTVLGIPTALIKM